MKRLCAVFLLLIFPQSLYGAFGIDDWAKLAGGTGTSLSGDLNVGSGADRVAYVAVTFESDTVTISSLQLEGVAMTSIHRETENNGGGVILGIEIFRLINPSTNATATVSGTLSSSVNWHVIGAAFTGVDQTTPNGTTFGANGTSAGPITVNVTGVNSGERVVDFVAATSDITTLTVGANQSEQQNNGNNQLRTGGSYEETTGTVTMSWTLSQVDGWVTGAFALKPAATSGGISSILSRRRR